MKTAIVYKYYGGFILLKTKVDVTVDFEEI